MPKPKPALRKPPNGKVKLSDFRPQAENLNRHTVRGMAAQAKSIQRDGLISGITVAANGESFDGSGTIENLADIMPDVKVVVIETTGDTLVVNRRTDIPTAKHPRARRLGYAANAVPAMNLDWDGEMLAALAASDKDVTDLARQENASLKALAEYGAGQAIADAEPQIDRAEELNQKWQVKTGDLWRIGEHRLLCGNCTVRENVERSMEGEKAAHAVTSPPYFVGKEYEQQKTEADIIGFIDSVCGVLAEVVNPSRRIVINCATTAWSHIGGKLDYHLNLDWWQVSFRKRGWLTRSIRIWAKTGGLYHTNPEADVVDTHWEFLATFWFPKSKIYRGQNRIGQGWATDGYWTEIQGEKQTGHSAPFPIVIPSRFIELYSDVDELVLEPFCGSGTTLVACQNLGRRCRAIEISPAYCAVTLERMATAFPDLPIERVTA